MLKRFLLSFSACGLILVAALMPTQAFAVMQAAFDRAAYDQAAKGLDLRPYLEYVIVPLGAMDADQVWQQDSASFKPMHAGERLEIPRGSMMIARVEIRVQQIRDPDYLQFPYARLDRVRLSARAVGQPWQHGEAGDRVPLSRWTFAGPFPAFELPDGNDRIQLIMAIEHRGSLSLPIEWYPDSAFRAARLDHGFTFGIVTGLAMTLTLVCFLALAFFRRIEFFTLGVYSFVSGMSISATNGYAGVYLWPQWPAWNDASKGFLGMVLVSLLLPLVGRVLQLALHRPRWWVACWRWALAGIAYACLQAILLPPEWRIAASLVYVVVTLFLAFALALHDVLRGDTMSRLTLLAIVIIAGATVLGYSDLFDLGSELSLQLINAAGRLGFVVLILIVAMQRHRYGRDVLARLTAGNNRDALTGFSNRIGLKEDLAREVLLADNADTRNAGMLLCDVQNIAVLRADLGDEACDRILVRIAHVLTGSMVGNDFLLGRLMPGRFGIILLGDVTYDTVQATATRVLSRMLAQHDLPNPVREMKLRIVMKLEPLAALWIERIEDKAKQHLEQENETRTISWLEAPPQAAYGEYVK